MKEVSVKNGKAFKDLFHYLISCPSFRHSHGTQVDQPGPAAEAHPLTGGREQDVEAGDGADRKGV